MNHEKVTDALENATKDLADTSKKLHLTNKVRHETEYKLAEEIEKSKGLQEVIRLKDETLNRKTQEIEDQDKRVIDLERIYEALDIKKQGIERQFELTKK